MIPTESVTVRHIGTNELHLVLRAQAASSYELDAMSATDVADALSKGQIQGVILEGPGREMILCWQRDGTQALLTCLHREGEPDGFVTDARRILDRAEGILKEWGVTRVYVSVGINNPNFERLHQMYERGGFKSDLIRMGKSLI